MATVHSIVRVKEPGHPSSYPVGRFEVSFVMAYRASLSLEFDLAVCRPVVRELTDEQARQRAEEIAATFNRCRYDPFDNRLRYVVESVGEESPKRAEAA